jgi:hypothetical protein
VSSITGDHTSGYNCQHARREALSTWLMSTATYKIETEVQEAKYKVNTKRGGFFILI